MSLPVAVFDTNVFVSALRSRRGASFRLLSLIGSGRFELVISVPLALEYEAVGLRTLPDTTLMPEAFDDLLNLVCREARQQAVYYSWRPCLPDPGDDMVLEVAVAAGGATVVTHNVRDFTGAERFGVPVCRPQEFLARIEEADRP